LKGVTVTVPVIELDPVLLATNEGTWKEVLVPLAANPIPVLLFVQLIFVKLVPERVTPETKPPLQAVTFDGAVSVGSVPVPIVMPKLELTVPVPQLFEPLTVKLPFVAVLEKSSVTDFPVPLIVTPEPE
jgi:hypothetical protein